MVFFPSFTFAIVYDLSTEKIVHGGKKQNQCEDSARLIIKEDADEKQKCIS
jgi:hypothetical protein